MFVPKGRFQKKSGKSLDFYQIPLEPLNFLYDFTLFVIDMHQNMPISLFKTLFDHFHFHPPAGIIWRVILKLHHKGQATKAKNHWTECTYIFFDWYGNCNYAIGKSERIPVRCGLWCHNLLCFYVFLSFLNSYIFFYLFIWENTWTLRTLLPSLPTPGGISSLKWPKNRRTWKTFQIFSSILVDENQMKIIWKSNENQSRNF